MKIISRIIALLLAVQLSFAGDWTVPVLKIPTQELRYKEVKSELDVDIKIKGYTNNQESCKLYVLVKNESDKDINYISDYEFKVNCLGKSPLKKIRECCVTPTVIYSGNRAIKPGETDTISIDMAKYFELKPGLHLFDIQLYVAIGESCIGGEKERVYISSLALNFDFSKQPKTKAN